MPLFQVDIEKRANTEFWSNVYLVNGSSLADANAVGLNLVSAEKSFHAEFVIYTKMRISSTVVGDGVFTIVTLSGTGEREGVEGLPLFNTLRFDFNAPTGRPSRKYYRGVLGEGDISGDAINTASFVAGSNAIAANFADIETPLGLVGPQGELFTGLTIHPFVQMRQLRRSRRKRTNGGGIFQ